MSGGAHGSGIVVASHGREALVDSGGALLLCPLRGRRLRPVCGDRAEWSVSPGSPAPLIDAIAPRRNLIERIDARGRPEPVVANIDCLAVLVAPEPQPDWFLVDRYCAAAALQDIPVLVIANKCDLGLDAIGPELAIYRGLGLRCIDVSCTTGAGLALLEGSLAGATLLVGQSGVGKSSLVNRLVPGAAATTDVLTRDAEGRHTTTTARWYTRGAAAVIDAPGVRDFAPPARLLRAAERGFAEIHALGVGCRFSDCRHFSEPQCAVRAAVSAGTVSARRYESYRRLVRLYEEFEARR